MTSTALTLLLSGFAVGFLFRARRAKTVEFMNTRHIEHLNDQIDRLDQRISRFQHADSERREKSEIWKRRNEENDISDTRNQIKFINQARLFVTKPVNEEAVLVLYALEDWIKDNQPGWRLSFEVSMGAFIKTARDQDAAFRSYNSKRVDFLLVDSYGKPMLVVEYHGTGHYLSEDAKDRMAVKSLVLQRAGVALVEIPKKSSRKDILRMVSESIAADAEMRAESAPS